MYRIPNVSQSKFSESILKSKFWVQNWCYTVSIRDNMVLTTTLAFCLTSQHGRYIIFG